MNGGGDLEGIYKDITGMREYVVEWGGMRFERFSLTFFIF
jgi:hypothetical protein